MEHYKISPSWQSCWPFKKCLGMENFWSEKPSAFRVVAQGSAVNDLAVLLVGSGGTSLWAHYSIAKLSLVPVTVFCLQKLAALQCYCSPVLGDLQRSSSPSWIVLGQRLVPMAWDLVSMGHSATHWPHFLHLPKGFVSITEQQGQSVAGQPNLLL